MKDARIVVLSRFGCSLLLILCCVFVDATKADAEDTNIQRESAEGVSGGLSDLNRLIAAGNLDSAAVLGRALDEKTDGDVDLSLPLAQIGRAFQVAGDLQLATEFFQRSTLALTRPTAEGIQPATRVIIRLSAASLLANVGKAADSLDLLRTALNDPVAIEQNVITQPQTQLAVALCLRIGADALAQGDSAMAAAAYEFASTHAEPLHRPTAMLGAAWSIAMSGQTPRLAAEKMTAFVEAFPEHQDSPRALRAAMQCYEQAADQEGVKAMLSELVQRFPDSESTVDAMVTRLNSPIDNLPKPVRDWVLSRADQELTGTRGASIVALAIRIAADDSDSAPFAAGPITAGPIAAGPSNLGSLDRFVLRLGQLDQTGQATQQLLTRLDERSDAPDSVSGPAKERLLDSKTVANFLISPPSDASISVRARETACRWAASHELWGLLAQASQATAPQVDDPMRSVAIERIFAESLMQTGRREEARNWWIHLVDVRGVSEFATLLRCAETEASSGDVTTAASRIEAAKQAAGDDRFRNALVAMLSAELAIRRARFDEARAELETVVRSSQSDAALRGRAQWLIGETFYLQTRYVDAIEAYRAVAGIDPTGQWVPAALVQAGKSFEQLGRTRDAAVCYSSLVSRYAESPFATIANQRLAALGPENAETRAAQNPKNSTLRR